MKHALPKYPFVIVVWEDHVGDGTGNTWRDMSDAKASNDVDNPCFTAGWLVAVSKERITVVPHIARGNERLEEQAGGHMTISRGLVHKIIRVKVPR